jgi:5'-nucleotidase / UDP-sugar diphosphatase
MGNRQPAGMIAFCVIAMLGVSLLAANAAERKPKSNVNAGLSESKGPIHVVTDLDSTQVTVQESNLGDLMADAVRESSGAEIALIPADEIAPVVIPAGNVSAGEVVKALRYSGDSTDTIAILNLTGAQLLQAASRSVSRTPHPFEGFLQVSGIHISYTENHEAARDVGVTITDAGAIDIKRTYRVATTRSLANGSFGYFEVWGKEYKGTGTTIASSLTTYLNTHKTINATIEGRITAQ